MEHVIKNKLIPDIKFHPHTLDPRRALRVKRYHTVPMLNEQTVGEHVAQLLRITMTIWPHPPRNFIAHILCHDMPECVLGDPPYPAKRVHPPLKDAMTGAEDKVVRDMRGHWSLPEYTPLTEEEHRVFKLFESIEMWECGLNEIEMGNKTAYIIKNQMEDAIQLYMPKAQSGANVVHTFLDIAERATAYFLQRKINHMQVMELS
jgi:5'-deoxynucleotidase YfbR-like HD superfamily hydrolase